jgi:4-hydroxybenzoate polyprenyltransferase
MIQSADQVADSTGNWVDWLAPGWLRPYLRLARFDRPIGSWLLLIPCWWSAAVAALSSGAPLNAWHLLCFFVGAFAMRGAGCTWNDIVDRDLDRLVERTRSRPIPSGAVTIEAAAVFVALQALVGLAMVLQFNPLTQLIALSSLGVVAIYPFMKRFTYWPQFVLGLAFSWGALVGWPALLGRLDVPPLLLYAGSIFWVIGYDTIYAHQDREDDALVGIKSTALLFGTRTKPMLVVSYGLAVLFLALAEWSAGAGPISAIGLAAFAGHLAWQVMRLDITNPALCLRLFKSNRNAGLLLFAAVAIEAVLRH